MRKRHTRALFVCLLITMVFTGRAHAYVDLGAGSYKIQIIVGFAAGGIYMMRSFLKKLFVSIKEKISGKARDDNGIKK